MLKRSILAVVAVFILWSLIDFVIHGVILQSSYSATSQLWRSMEEMKMGLMRVVVLISSISFVFIYQIFISEKSVSRAANYGLLYGLGTGISMAYGSYAVMSVPYNMALTWFLGKLLATVAGGLVMGLIIRD